MTEQRPKKQRILDWAAMRQRLEAGAAPSESEAELKELFRERARILARGQRADREQVLEEHLKFYAADVAFAVALTDVHTIVASPSTARIPGAPSQLQHLAYADGRVVPIFDLGPMLGRSALPTAELRKRRVVIVRAGSELLGLAVGQVLEVLGVALSRLSPAPVGSWSAEVSRGVTEELVTVLNVSRLWQRARTSTESLEH